ncbi:hypothetical protein G6O69_34590 [Pseudenhygromyxa sp. WMMC2535]|uniref:hypothetical protein n=1 Tax=Pseudenhygromyxa sp. WMMC2535 TaxID=2712867 RepID=UPI001595AFDA|nr:hypothetical protein [Pseudenhygromyxa sp. WMMC2535]NVB43002.1 hypothetical protein [Pseudenhygromyxa sp. WMMC2535]
MQLELSEVDPIVLDGSLNTSGGLQFAYGSDNLADYSNNLYATHVDLEDPNAGTIRVKLMDFSASGVSWTVTASHDPGSGTVNWSRDSSHVYCDFGPMTDWQSVTATATAGAQTKQLTLGIKTVPTDPQPDKPRR